MNAATRQAPSAGEAEHPARRARRLLVLLPSFRFGGTERQTVELAARLARRTGVTVTLAAEPRLRDALMRAVPQGYAAPALIPANTGWEDGAPPEVNIARQAAEAGRLLQAVSPDLGMVALPWPNAGLGLMRALAQARLPRLIALHLIWDGPAPPGLDAASAAACAPSRAAWAAVSAPVAARAAQLFGLPREAVQVIPNASAGPPAADRALVRTQLRAVLGLPPDAPLLLFVGRLERGKGADLLPGIASGTGMTVAVAGTGPLRQELERAAAADPSVGLRLLGHLGDPGPWYLAADALLLPSRMEGAPLVFLEAAAARLPVVATAAALESLGAKAARVASVVEVAEAGPMVEATLALLADPAGRAARMLAAAALADGLTWDRCVESWAGALRLALLRGG